LHGPSAPLHHRILGQKEARLPASPNFPLM
jgi:hypothetical protein